MQSNFVTPPLTHLYVAETWTLLIVSREFQDDRDLYNSIACRSDHSEARDLLNPAYKFNDDTIRDSLPDASDGNKDLGLKAKAKAKDLDPKDKDSRYQGQNFSLVFLHHYRATLCVARS